MNSYNFEISIERDLNPPIHPIFLEQFQSQLFPRIEKKLQKAGYLPNDYLIKFMEKFWVLKPQDYSQLSKGYTWFRGASIWRRSGYRAGYDLITGSIELQWKISYCIEDINIDIAKNEIDLTNEMISKSAKLLIGEIDLMPYLVKHEAKPANVIPLLRFEYELNCEWPDVIFQIHFNERITAKTVNNVEALINKFSNNWNDSLNDNEDDNIIDYVGSAESEESGKSVNIHVDFGRSDPEKVLMPMLKHLSDSELDIKKIVLT